MLMKPKLLLETDKTYKFKHHGVVITLKSDNFFKAVKALFLYKMYSGDDFFTLLLKLVAKADKENKLKLLGAYPEYVIAYDLWYLSSDKIFFDKYLPNEYTQGKQKKLF